MTEDRLLDPKDYRTPVTDKFIEGFANDSLTLDLPVMQLRQLKDESPTIYRGRGLLRVHRDRDFEFRMYADATEQSIPTRPFEALLRMQSHTPGELIPLENYFELTATDLNGYGWQCQQVKVNEYITAYGAVLAGQLHAALSHLASDLRPSNKAGAVLYFFNHLPVVLDGRTTTRTHEGDETVSVRDERVFARVEAGGMSLHVRRLDVDKEATMLEILSAGAELPMGIELRLEEALSYATVSAVRWCLLVKRVGTSREVTLVPRRLQDKSKFIAPVGVRGPTQGHFWDLFKAYFEYVLPYANGDSYHPLSIQLYHVVVGEARDLSLLGLIVSVAVEGVLNAAFENLSRPTPKFSQAIEKALKLVSRLRCEDPALANRMRGALGAMKRSRASDKLKLLVAVGVVTAEQVQAWNTLRNTSTHAGGKYDPDKTDETLALFNVVYGMLHRLVFQAIGYSGRYTEFSARGWPVEEFRPKSFAAPDE